MSTLPTTKHSSKRFRHYQHQGDNQHHLRLGTGTLTIIVIIITIVIETIIIIINITIVLRLGTGTLATVVGWGRMGVHEGAPHSSVLQAVTVPVLTRRLPLLSSSS